MDDDRQSGPADAPAEPAPAGGSAPARGLRPRWAVAILLAVGLLAYANSFRGKFLLDDHDSIVNRPQIRQLWPLWGKVLRPGDLRPLVTLSLAVNYAVSGLDPWSYHAVNLAVHLLAALVLFGIVRRTLLSRRLRGALGPAAGPLALAVALLWMVHPLQTQSVTYVVQRAESMMGLFYLLTLYCVIRGATGARRIRWYAGAVAACALGAACKPVIVTAPIIVLLYDRIFLSRSFGELVRRRWALHAGLLAVSGALVLAWFGPGGPTGETITVGFRVREITWLEYARSQFGVILHYLGLALWPDDLCFDYAWRVAMTARQIVLPAAVVGALVVLTAVALWRRPAGGFLGAWFFIILAPTSSIVPVADLAVEHRMYLPLAAVVALVVVVAWLAGRQVLDRLIRSDESRRVLGPYLAAGAAVLVAVALGLRTLRRNQDYADEVRMYADVVRQRPLNPRAHLNLGLELMERGLKANLERMRQHFEVALRLMPELADTHNAMGIVHAEDGKLPEAVKEFETALELNPRLNEARFNMANALERQSKLTEAIRWYREGLKRNPYVPQVHIRLGTIYAELGNYSEAERSFRAAIELAPRRNEARLALGRLWHRQTRIEEAVQVFREAVRIDPGSAQAWHHLGAAEATRGNATSAEGCFRRALAADRSLAEASAGLRRIESIRAAASRRVRELRRRLRADGDDPQVMAALARVLAACMDESLRDGPRAVELAERACLATKRQDPECLDTLAAAYAEVGRFGDALDTAKLAGERAIQAGNTELALEIQRRRELYQAGRPYRQERWP